MQITIDAETVKAQIPDSMPGEAVSITGTLGAATPDGGYTITDGVVTKEAVEDEVEAAAPAAPAAPAAKEEMSAGLKGMIGE